MRWIKTFDNYKINKFNYEVDPKFNDDISNFNEIYNNLGFNLGSLQNELDGIKITLAHNLYTNTIFNKLLDYYNIGNKEIKSTIFNATGEYGVYRLGFFSFKFNDDNYELEQSPQFGRLHLTKKLTIKENISEIYNGLYEYIKYNVTYYITIIDILGNSNKKIKLPYIKETIVECLSYREKLTKEIIAKIFLDKIINIPDAGPILEIMKEKENQWYDIFLKINPDITSLSDPTDMGLYD